MHTQHTPMRHDPPLTPESLELARAAQAAERAAATAQTGIRFDADGRPYLPRVLPFVSDAADDAVRPLVRYDLMQMRESRQAGYVADALAVESYNLALRDLPRRERAGCLAVAVHALRSQQPCWTQAARAHAVEAMAESMRTEAGAELAQMPEAQRLALARLLAGVALAAYHGITEGTIHLPPALYLKIVDGDRG